MNRSVDQLVRAEEAQREASQKGTKLALREANFIGSVVVPEYKLVLCSLPKNACSVLRMLMLRLREEPNAHWNANSSQPHPSRNQIKSWNDRAQNKRAHVELQSLPRQEIERIANDPAWLKVAFVRNPYTRVLSGYLEKVKRGILGVGKATASSTFEHFVDELVTRSPRYLNEHFRDQSDMCSFNFLQYDVIGKIESLRDDLRCVASAKGFLDAVDYGWAKGYPKGNDGLLDISTSHETRASAKIREYYTDDIAAKVYSRFRTDFEAFHYPQELPSAPEK
eukprot:CAMPEP_0185854146 /NCGR_PEP_ID=MMETSP1354-20130828/21471_1 /TAXON_ID=708628 /ORGANISM="Erythrolobus madagascarensis, Strain CCMP3276" /LENGTH=279 /DNA_ID=CAMNT_0028555835 /DNA_START=10 /DNA_END=849 /DNA_ORIENTATION=+